jgi:serine/threonine-protein kinase
MGRHRRIGDIQPFAELAQGTATVVYKGYQPSLERFVLLKVLRPAFSQDTELVERLEQEARLAATIQHPNVVAIYAYGQDDGQPYLAAEFVDGVDLRTLLQRGPLPVELATFVTREAARGLRAAHERDVLHRDIKPANLLIAHDGQVKLTDFGLASLIDQSANVEVRGTWSYLAPEVVRGATPTNASDLFSLGATLFEMLTARVPFSGADTSAVLDAVLHHDPLPLLDRLAPLPDGLRRICTRLLAKDPAARYASATALIDDLETLRAERVPSVDETALATYVADPAAYVSPAPPQPEVAPETSDASPAPPDAPPSSSEASGPRRWPRRALLAVLVVGLTLIGTLLAVSMTSDPPADADPVRVADSVPADLSRSASSPATPPDTTLDRVAASSIDTASARPPAIDTTARTAAAEVRTTLPAPDTSAAAATPDRSEAAPGPVASRRIAGDPSSDGSMTPAVGTLTVQASPWAEVLIDGTFRGRTPLGAPLTLNAGTHTVTLRHPQFPDSTMAVALSPGDSTALSVSLWDLVGTLSLEVSPWADVFIGGEQRDTTPLERPLILPPGRHTLTLRNPTLGRLDTTLTIRRGEEHAVRINLNRLLAQ